MQRCTSEQGAAGHAQHGTAPRAPHLDEGGEATGAGRHLQRLQLRGVLPTHEVGKGDQRAALHSVLPAHKQRLGGGLVHLGCGREGPGGADYGFRGQAKDSRTGERSRGDGLQREAVRVRLPGGQR